MIDDFNLLLPIALITLIMILVPIGIARGIIKVKGVVIKAERPSRREVTIVGLAVLFLLIQFGFAMSSPGSGAAIIGLGILLAAILGGISRRWK